MRAAARRRKVLRWAGPLAALLGGTPAPARGAETPASQPALVAHVDRTYGYELALPAGWSLDRTSFPGPAESIGVLRASSGGGTTLAVLIFREDSPRDWPAWVERFSRQVGDFTGTTRVEVRLYEGAARPEAVVTADARLGASATNTIYYCVRFDETITWVAALATVLGADEAGERAEARALFERLAGTLLVHYDPRAAEELRAALERGREFAARSLPARLTEYHPPGRELCFELTHRGRGVGYMTTRSERGAPDAGGAARKNGLRVRERIWRFGDDGSALLTRIDLFSSDDQLTDMIEVGHVSIPPHAAADPTPLRTLDQCVREGDVLFSSLTSSSGPALPQPRRPLRLGEGYLGLAWVRAMPALLGGEPEPPCAFVCYDVESRALATRCFEPLGRHPLPDAPDASSRVIRVREGFSPRPTWIYTDDDGEPLRIDAGDLTLRRADPRQIEERYGARRAAAEKALERR